MDKNKIQTEWELNNNVIGLCVECTNERREKWQKENKDLKINVEDFVKICISDGNGKEHLWFKVIKVHKNEFVGRCDNVPVIIETVKFNNIASFKFEDIEDIYNG